MESHRRERFVAVRLRSYMVLRSCSSYLLIDLVSAWEEKQNKFPLSTICIIYIYVCVHWAPSSKTVIQAIRHPQTLPYTCKETSASSSPVCHPSILVCSPRHFLRGHADGVLLLLLSLPAHERHLLERSLNFTGAVKRSSICNLLGGYDVNLQNIYMGYL